LEDRPSGTSEVPFTLIHDFLIVVQGSIGNLTGLKFILDTGTTNSMVDRRLARRLGVQLHRNQVFDFARFIPIESGVFARIEFGPIQLTNLSMFVADLSRISEFATDADALIGSDLLTLNNFSIDYDANKVLFSPRERPALSANLHPVSLIVELQVQGQPVDLLVDTGIEGIVMVENRLRDRLPRLRMSEERTEGSLGGIRAKWATLQEAHLGPIALDPRVLLVKGPPGNFMQGIYGFFGIASLKAHCVDFNFRNGRLSWR